MLMLNWIIWNFYELIGQTWLFNLCMATSLGEGKLNSNLAVDLERDELN